ncbi:bacterial Ig-like domain-containing protein [Thomasclavelia spiroformis DSM 1552]|uniref:Bacterial group 3 Ig-like protein n=1 Tax=Thomasclavelia spiroformis DSM 1552 TaxID=428126 RepID=B1C298_9FIRM|nr:bacterial Ig-like domain-containing protein [Thomasclavelia spiroformis]EDS75040.1 bacterial group 3 Ig-like protein [Thomasclavelia spiroformis DSM 1552]UWO90675.1 bacterial Ig-like domain-containing protein [Thomasclavelia spiroformis DSM 1552]
MVAPYDGGKLKEEVHQAMTDLTNFYRWLAGVNPYENVSSHDQNLQNFAVIETLYFNATGSLNHYSGSSNLWSKPNDMSDEFWQSAFAPNKIIAYGSSPQASIEQWFEEGYNQRQNAFNTTGHRDMLLSYQTTGMTFAYTDRMAIGRQLGGETMNLPCTAYPAPGPYPNISLNPEETAWSIELNDQQLSYDNINDITIKVTNLTTNESYECTAKNNKLTTVSYGYGFAFAQPEVNTDTYVDSYKIEILGLKDLNENDKIVTYQTDLFDPATMLSSNVVKVDYAWTNVHDSLWNENSVDENDIFGVMPTEIIFETDNGRKELLEIGWLYKSSGLGEKWMNVAWYFLPENVNDHQNLISDFGVYFDRIRNTDSDKNLKYMVTENETLTMEVTPYENWPIDEYNWYKSQSNGDPILIAQTCKPTFTIENVTKEDAGKYFVIYRITNDLNRNTFITPYKTVTVKEPLALDHLEVTSTKTKYVIGQDFDPESLDITAYYNDDSSKKLNYNDVTITGFDSSSLGEKTITVTYKEDNKTVSTTFKIEIIEKEVKDIVLTPPTKVKYVEGQSLDLTGGKVIVSYNDDTSEEIDLTSDMVSGYDKDHLGKQTIIVTYQGKTATFEVEVIKKEATKIELVTLPNKIEYIRGQKLDSDGAIKTEYIEGQPLDISNLKVIALYNDGTSEVIDASMDMISGYDVNIIGKQTITVTYKGKTTTFDVNVIEKVITKIEMNSLPNKVNYLVDQKFEINGATIKVYYNDGSEEIVNVDSNMFNLPNMSKIGNQTIIVNYGGLTTSLEILINDKTLVNITVSTLPDKTEYIEGQGLDVTGGKLLLTYDNGSSEIIDITLAMCSVDMSKPGQVNVSVIYNGFTVTYPILIKEKTPVSLI